MKTVLKPWFLLFGLLLIVLLFSGCTGTGTVPRGWSGVTVDKGTLFLGSMDGRIVAVNTANGSLMWSVLLQNPPSGGGGFGCAPAPTAVAIYGTPTVDGDLVYISGYNGKVYAISASTRLSKDTYLRKDNKSTPKPIIAGVAVAAGKVYAGSSDGLVYGLDTVSLDLKWQFASGDKIWSTPAVAGDTVYVTSFDKKLYALDANTGSKKWEFKTEGAIVSPPIIDGGTVYFGALDRYFYAVNVADGSPKWKFLAGKWFWAKPIVHNGIVYAANLDGKVYAINAASGQKQVEFNLGGPSSASPVMVGNMLIVATEAGKIYSLDTVTPSAEGQKLLADLGEKVFSALAASGGKVYIHSNNDRLYEIDASSGAKRELNIK